MTEHLLKIWTVDCCRLCSRESRRMMEQLIGLVSLSGVLELCPLECHDPCADELAHENLTLGDLPNVRQRLMLPRGDPIMVASLRAAASLVETHHEPAHTETKHA